MWFSIQIVLMLTLFVWVEANGTTVAKIRRRTYTFEWQAPTEPSTSVEDEAGQTLLPAEILCQYALNMTREVLDIQKTFLAEVQEQFLEIKRKNKIKWDYKFEGILENCHSIIADDQEEIHDRLVGAYGAPGLTHNPFRPASISNLIHNFNHLMILIEDDKELKEVDKEIPIIRRVLDDAEAELHRFNFRVRRVMTRIERRLSSTTDVNSTQTTTLVYLTQS